MNLKILIPIAVIIVVVGILGGFFLARRNTSSASGASGNTLLKTNTQAGVKDCKGDSATGTLDTTSGKEQGTHKLLRDGGPSQTLYMVSSVVDLEEYVGKKLEICGDTQKLQGVSWFMDVAQVKIVE